MKMYRKLVFLTSPKQFIIFSSAILNIFYYVAAVSKKSNNWPKQQKTFKFEISTLKVCLFWQNHPKADEESYEPAIFV
jgi:hypothetical protein